MYSIFSSHFVWIVYPFLYTRGERSPQFLIFPLNQRSCRESERCVCSKAKHRAFENLYCAQQSVLQLTQPQKQLPGVQEAVSGDSLSPLRRLSPLSQKNKNTCLQVFLFTPMCRRRWILLEHVCKIHQTHSEGKMKKPL